MMSLHLVLPRKGHMEQVMQIFGYFKKYHNAELVFDPSNPIINEQDFEKKDWTSSEFRHIEGREELPPPPPPPPPPPTCPNQGGWDLQSLPKWMRTMHLIL